MGFQLFLDNLAANITSWKVGTACLSAH